MYSRGGHSYHHVYVGIILPQEALLAAAVIISSYLATEDRTYMYSTIEKDMIEGNWLEAATWVSYYSSRTKFKARAKASCAESGSGIVLHLEAKGVENVDRVFSFVKEDLK